jgi:cardiolipin synthase
MLSDALLWILPPLLIALAVGAAGHALLTKLNSSSAFGWIALCIILPLAGPIIYLLFGINRVSKRARKTYLTKLLKDSSDTLNEPPGTDFRPLSMVGERIIKKGLSSCDEIVVLENGEALYPAMLEAINTAARRILLSTYIFDNDETGRQFVQALAAARERGVEVKVIVDGMGEFTSLPRIGSVLRRHQIDFVRFNPITLIPPALDLNMRSHRKVLVVDGVFAFTGGANIGIRHLSERVGHWDRAMDIHFRLRGRIVDELEWAFRRDWHYCQGTRHLGPFQHCNRIHDDAPAWSRLILDGPNKDLDRINDLILGVVSAARHKVWIMTPYFLPTLDLIGALHAAYLRGVDVQILLPGYNNI